jgi:hypothetical protein
MVVKIQLSRGRLMGGVWTTRLYSKTPHTQESEGASLGVGSPGTTPLSEPTPRFVVFFF